MGSRPHREKIQYRPDSGERVSCCQPRSKVVEEKGCCGKRTTRVKTVDCCGCERSDSYDYRRSDPDCCKVTVNNKRHNCDDACGKFMLGFMTCPCFPPMWFWPFYCGC